MKKGFTLIELLFAAGILIVALAALLGVYVLCFNLTETAKNLTLATNAINQKFEQIRDYGFYKIYTDFNNTTFNVPGFASQDAKGSVVVNNSNPDLIKVTISISWRQKSGRIIGADNGSGGGIAFNGIADGAEQTDADGTLKSPAKIVTLMTSR